MMNRLLDDVFAAIVKPAIPKPPAMPSDPGLPPDLLPRDLEAWLHDTAVLAGVPPVMITVPYLAGAGAVLGNRLGLQLQPGWIEYPTLWIALVALTGTGKTPALMAARQPFDHLHAELHDAWRESKTTSPFAPLVTTEAAWPRLQQVLPDANGLLLHRDELLGFIQAVNRRAGEDRQRYLSLWSGDVLHDTTYQAIHHPVVSIVGGIQPLLLYTLRRKQHDGLLERFLPVLAGGKTAHWNHQLPSVPALEVALHPLRQLRHLQPGPVITLSGAAHDLWVSWFDAQIDLTRSASLVIGGFYRKYPVHLARLILVIHALWHPDNPGIPVSRHTVDRAITLIEYLRLQLHRSLTLVNQKHPLRTPAETLVAKIEQRLAAHQPDDGWLGRSVLYRQLGSPASSLFTTALDLLLETGRIEHRVNQGSRGRPAAEYRLRPAPGIAAITSQPA
jgi:hypothetical protein